MLLAWTQTYGENQRPVFSMKPRYCRKFTRRVPKTYQLASGRKMADFMMDGTEIRSF